MNSVSFLTCNLIYSVCFIMGKDVGVCLMKVDWMVFKRFFLPHTQTIRLYIDRPALKGTNGRQKTYEIFHVYCIFYSGFRCQTTVIFGVTKDGILVFNTLASWNCFTCRNLFQNGANDMSECLTFETAFCKKSSKFCVVRIIRFWSNFASLW